MSVEDVAAVFHFFFFALQKAAEVRELYGKDVEFKGFLSGKCSSFHVHISKTDLLNYHHLN